MGSVEWAADKSSPHSATLLSADIGGEE